MGIAVIKALLIALFFKEVRLAGGWLPVQLPVRHGGVAQSVP